MKAYSNDRQKWDISNSFLCLGLRRVRQYPLGSLTLCTLPWIHVQNLAIRYEQGAELVMRYGPICRFSGQTAESQQLHLKADAILYSTSVTKNFYIH
jgi:hypothetical protein